MPEHHFPTEVLEIRVLHPSLAQRLVREVVHMLENEQPGHQPRRQRQLPGHTELKRPARKSQLISPASRTSAWRRLMIASRGGRNKSSWRSSRGWLIGLPRQRISPSKESQTTQIGESQTARKPAAITCSSQIIAIDQSLPHSSRTNFIATAGRVQRQV